MENNTQKILQHIINNCPIEILNYKCDYVGLQFSNANGYYFIGEDLYVTYDGGSTGKSITEFKLLLRDISEVVEEIEVAGVKFIPAERTQLHLGYTQSLLMIW